MAKSDRDEVLNLLASRIFSTMLDDIVMDAAVQSHQEEKRYRVVCDVCHTRCGQAHVSGPSNAVNGASQNGLPSTRPSTPAGDAKASGTPSKDGNILLDCVNCGRQVASNRYAPHLSSCLGIGTGTRRAAARNANAKPKMNADAGRSASPYLGSDNGNVSDDSSRQSQPVPKQPKPKGRPPKNKPKAPAEDATNHRKRPGSPLTSPPKKSKKQKISGTRISTTWSPVAFSTISLGAPLTRVKSIGDNGALSSNHHPTLPPTNSHSKIPSRLRESSTASFLEPEPSTSSRSSTPGTIPISAATPSSHTSESRNWNLNGNSKPNGAAKQKKLPPRLPSPPRPPSPVIRRPETDYLVDVEGDETGSSTDTDSD
ncbi:hypothetical protein BV25DRAFT_1987511 [Artomyces pyxidatus]|uniref:Uncharacterized protein n=1 Tax=Artomyces pyxidatus TaxID=48021 RepID=A0ACB8THG6_9AGAM|nr:hypothetical protein BV25DRAFT_1987511 [Artomyces pyxidatus]